MRKISIVSVLLLVVLAFSTLPFVYSETPTIETMTEAPGYLVEFKGSKLPKNAEAIIEGCGGAVTSMLPEIAVVGAMPNGNPADFEAALANNDAIKCFDHDYIVELPDISMTPVTEELQFESNGPLFTDPYYWVYQWHLWHTIEVSPWAAWTITTGSPDISVAVLDTGIDWNHGDIAPNYDFGASASFVPYEDEMDYHGHGTWCGGLIAAAVNDDPNDWKVIGIGPNLNLVNLKVMDSSGGGYFSWTFQAVYHAVAHGVDVISMSFGGYLPRGVDRSFLSICNKVFNYAQRNGIVCVASAGNAGIHMDDFHAYYVHIPSQCEGVIDVIATDIHDGRAPYSNYGSSLHGISAPGGYWEFNEPSWYEPVIPPAFWAPHYGFTFSTTTTVSGYKYMWAYGTSMACPHVAGVAGLILSVNPNLRPSQVRHLLFTGAVDHGDPGFDEIYNFGLLNAYNSLQLALKTLRAPTAGP
ncbi:MAG: S8 family serine peptidase [Candidatus Bathyarchaeota archaeon]|nr:MAG: S8 family serine peptidase [Candidatus Bathyarchaeota archaeon]